MYSPRDYGLLTALACFRNLSHLEVFQVREYTDSIWLFRCTACENRLFMFPDWNVTKEIAIQQYLEKDRSEFKHAKPAWIVKTLCANFFFASGGRYQYTS